MLCLVAIGGKNNSQMQDLWVLRILFLTLQSHGVCNPMEYTDHGILQARILEGVAFPFSRGSSQPRDQTQISRTECRFFTS